jgi:hypothetical protein
MDALCHHQVHMLIITPAPQAVTVIRGGSLKRWVRWNKVYEEH